MPYASAKLKGNMFAPNLDGLVDFFPWLDGTLVKVEVANLPPTKIGTDTEQPIGPFAFHIHEGNICGNDTKKFESAKGHYNPTNTVHAFHAGDLPSLLSNDGYAYMVVYTNRFKPEEVVNRTVIIHLHPDDYRTQPSGNAGERIACGVIQKV